MERNTMTQNALINSLQTVVKYVVMGLAIMMTLVIFWGALDVAILLYDQLLTDPFLRIGSEHLLAVLGAFLTVLIAIEIFLNIILYLTKHMFHVQLVVATALTAVVRKVIVLEYTVATAPLVFAIAATILAVGICYWITKQTKEELSY